MKTIILLLNQFTLSQELHIYDGAKQTKQITAHMCELNKILEEEIKDKKSSYNIIIKGSKELFEGQLPALKFAKNTKWIKKEN